MTLQKIVDALRGFGERNTIDLPGMLVEFLQGRNEEARSYRINDRIDLVAKWLDEILQLESIDEYMSAPRKGFDSVVIHDRKGQIHRARLQGIHR